MGKELMECIFGYTKMMKAFELDREWCEGYCRNPGIESHNKSYTCFWHFMKLGLDMGKN